MTRSSLDFCLADFGRSEILALFERADEIERGAPRRLDPGVVALSSPGSEVHSPGDESAPPLAPEAWSVLASLAALRAQGHAPDDLVLAWVGPATSHLHAWLEAAAALGFTFRFAVPDGHEPDAGLFLACEGRAPGRIVRTRDEAQAGRGAVLVLGPDNAEIPFDEGGAAALRVALDEHLAVRRRGRVDFKALLAAVPPPS